MKLNSVNLCRMVALCLAFSFAGALQAKEFTTKSTNPVANTGVTYQWHDGQQTNQCVMSSDLIAEFIPANGKGVVADAFPNATSESLSGGNVKIWKIGQVKDINLAIQAARSVGTTSLISPVFYQSSSGGPKMALPGNVIVEFKPSLSEAQISVWLKQNGYTVVKTMSLGSSKFYVLQTGPGLESLDTANKIFASGVAKRSQPNWWNEFVPR